MLHTGGFLKLQPMVTIPSRAGLWIADFISGNVVICRTKVSGKTLICTQGALAQLFLGQETRLRATLGQVIAQLRPPWVGVQAAAAP